MHCEHRGRTNARKGITQQKELPPKLAPLAAFGLFGLAAQIRQGRIKPLAAWATGSRGQTQLKLAFTGFHLHPQGFDDWSSLEP